MKNVLVNMSVVVMRKKNVVATKKDANALIKMKKHMNCYLIEFKN